MNGLKPAYSHGIFHVTVLILALKFQALPINIFMCGSMRRLVIWRVCNIFAKLILPTNLMIIGIKIAPSSCIILLAKILCIFMVYFGRQCCMAAVFARQPPYLCMAF